MTNHPYNWRMISEDRKQSRFRKCLNYALSLVHLVIYNNLLCDL